MLIEVSSARVKRLATLLFERRGEAVVVPYVERMIARWKPEEHQCHWNMDLWVAGEDGAKAVRGWLFFDHKTTSGGRVNSVTFQAHSVLEENGVLVDITSTRASRRYPFIRHEVARRTSSNSSKAGYVY